jgi:biotin carboxyl carrier protein
MSEASLPQQTQPLNFDLDTVREVAALLRESELGEICIETTNEDAPPARLLLRRAVSTPAPVPTPIPVSAENTGAAQASAEAAASTSAPSGAPTAKITSPAVGVFRPAKAPVKAGDVVKAGQTIGCVESMRVPNEIPTPVAGQVLEVCAGDGQGVEYGQVLFVIEETL